MVSSIDGATALKLDESYEIKNNDEQNAVIDSFEANEESQIAEQNITQNNLGNEIPSGVSIESASYIENNNEIKSEVTPSNELSSSQSSYEEEYTPKLFSEEQIQEENVSEDLREDKSTEELFDQDTNEDENFEIPAFLRRQKF